MATPIYGGHTFGEAGFNVGQLGLARPTQFLYNRVTYYRGSGFKVTLFGLSHTYPRLKSGYPLRVKCLAVLIRRKPERVVETRIVRRHNSKL